MGSIMHLTAEKKAQKEAMLQAIEALKSRGCDVNPYSVAAEADVPRQLVLRNPELMQAMASARLSSNGHAATSPSTSDNNEQAEPAESARLRQQVEQLEMTSEALNRDLEQANWDNQVLRRQIEDLEAENKKFREDAELLQSEAQNLAKSVNLAWQQGYLAGQHAATEEIQQQKTFVESLAEAAKAATSYSGEESQAGQPSSAPEPQQEPVSAATDSGSYDAPSNGNYYAPMQDPYRESVAETETTLQPMESVSYFGNESFDHAEEPYVADIELNIEDPDLLNDPFTAKLLSALHGEGDEEEPAAEAQQDLPENYIYSQSYSEEPPEPVYDDVSVDAVTPMAAVESHEPIIGTAESFAQQPDGIMPQAPQTPPPLTPPPIPQTNKALREEGETTQNFTADELHNLFRNKVLRGDEPAPAAAAPPPEEKPKDPAISTTTKKFVGSKAQSSAEPLQAMQRNFPRTFAKLADCLD